MKLFLTFYLISMIPALSSASLSDISKISSDPNLAAFFSKYSEVQAISWKITQYCNGGPSVYEVTVKKESGEVCEEFVQVGKCSIDPDRTTVEVIAESSTCNPSI